MFFRKKVYPILPTTESDTMTFFAADIEKGTLAMNCREIKIEKPNCIIFYLLEE